MMSISNLEKVEGANWNPHHSSGKEEKADSSVREAAQKAFSQENLSEPATSTRKRRPSIKRLGKFRSKSQPVLRSASFADKVPLDILQFLRQSFSALEIDAHIGIEGIYRESPDFEHLEQAVNLVGKGMNLQQILIQMEHKLDQKGRAILLSSLIKKLIQDKCGSIPFLLFAIHFHSFDVEKEGELIPSKMQDIYLKVHSSRQDFMREFLDHLAAVAKLSNKNRMDAENLSKVLAPIFFEFPWKPDQQITASEHGAMIDMIRQSSVILKVCIEQTIAHGSSWLNRSQL